MLEGKDLVEVLVLVKRCEYICCEKDSVGSVIV